MTFAALDFFLLDVPSYASAEKKITNTANSARFSTALKTIVSANFI